MIKRCIYVLSKFEPDVQIDWLCTSNAIISGRLLLSSKTVGYQLLLLFGIVFFSLQLQCYFCLLSTPISRHGTTITKSFELFQLVIFFSRRKLLDCLGFYSFVRVNKFQCWAEASNGQIFVF